jgi:hypothetical protein
MHKKRLSFWFFSIGILIILSSFFINYQYTLSQKEVVTKTEDCISKKVIKTQKSIQLIKKIFTTEDRETLINLYEKEKIGIYIFQKDSLKFWNNAEIPFKEKPDEFIKDIGLVVDWKTSTKSGFRYFGNQQQRYQIHTYGWLLQKNGYEVKEVALVGIPRDGKMADIKIFREPYDPAVAEEGLAWLENIKQLITNNSPAPAPEKFVSFCKDYCPYFDMTGVKGCQSIQR